MSKRRVQRAIRISLAAVAAVLVLATGIGAVAAHAATPTGQERALVLRLTWSGADSSGSDSLDSDITGGVNSWMRTASRGVFSGWSVTDPGVITISQPTLSPPPASPCDNTFKHAMEVSADQAALDRGYNISDFNVIIYSAPPEPCTATGDIGGLRVHLYGSTSQRTLIHELGHHLGLSHAHALNCTDGSGNPVTLSSQCSTNEYGDYPSEMGTGRGIYSAIQLASLGWLPGLVADVPQNGGEYDLQPLDTLAGGAPRTRALRIPDGSNIIWVEYRQPGSLDDDTFDQGVFIHLQRPDGPNPYGSFLLNMSPSLANLPAGASWADPLGHMKITVNSADTSLAHITVSNTLPQVPNLLSSTVAEATTLVIGAGLTLGPVSYTNNCVDPGTVQNQNPIGGAWVQPGTSVYITVSQCTGGGGGGGGGIIEK